MKSEYEALLARANEFNEFVKTYAGPEVYEWQNRINMVLTEIDVIGRDIVE